MPSAFDVSDLPGPPTCCVCGTADAPRYVGGYGYHMCAGCLAADELAEPVPEGASCVLCGLQIGDRSPWLRRRAVVVAMCREGIVLCARCQYTALAILAEGQPRASTP
jgi:hypothetical protein